MAINGAAMIRWIKDVDNRALFEEHVLPLICVANARVIGGRHKIMFKDWSWNIAMSMYESGVDDKLIDWEPIPDGEPNEGELYPAYNYARMEFVFGHLGRMLITKWQGLLSPEKGEEARAEEKRREEWLNRSRSTNVPKSATNEEGWNPIEIEGEIQAAAPVSVPEPDSNAKQGWLSPAGHLYPCEVQGHNRLQVALQNNFGIADIERNGWIKLGYCMVRKSYDEWLLGNPDREASREQIRIIEAWCAKRGSVVPDYLKELIKS